jgi:hypothetical protein
MGERVLRRNIIGDEPGLILINIMVFNKNIDTMLIVTEGQNIIIDVIL